MPVAGPIIGAVGSIGGALIGNKGPKTTNAVPKWLDTASQDAISRASGIADRPYEGYTGERVAGLSANEQQAYGLAGSMANRYQPMIARGGAAFSRGALEQFENPYMESVVQGRLGDVGRDFDAQFGALNRRRGMMDAFGTDRGALLESSLQRNKARELDRISNEGRASAYQSALDSYFKDKSSALDAARVGTAVDATTIGQLGATGGVERNIRQAGDDFDYGQFLERRDWDVNNLQPLLAAIGAARGGSTTSTKPGQNYGTALAGLSSVIGSMFTGGRGGDSGLGASIQSDVNTGLTDWLNSGGVAAGGQ